MREYRFDEIWPELIPAIVPLYESLVDAIDYANLSEQNETRLLPCPIRWASTVRSFVGKDLPPTIGPEDFDLSVAFNVSLTIHGQKASVRVLKAPLGDLPSATGPGRTAFFNQMPPPGCRYEWSLFEPEEESNRLDIDVPSNFVVVWSTDHGRLVGFRLAYPKPCEADAGEDAPQEWFWSEEVLGRIASVISDREQTKDRHIEDSGDLDLRRIDEDDDKADDDDDFGDGTFGR